MNIFKRDGKFQFARFNLGFYLRESELDGLLFLGIEDADFGEHVRVGKRALNIFPVESLVDRDAGVNCRECLRRPELVMPAPHAVC